MIFPLFRTEKWSHNLSQGCGIHRSLLFSHECRKSRSLSSDVLYCACFVFAHLFRNQKPMLTYFIITGSWIYSRMLAWIPYHICIHGTSTCRVKRNISDVTERMHCWMYIYMYITRRLISSYTQITDSIWKWITEYVEQCI